MDSWHSNWGVIFCTQCSLLLWNLFFWNSIFVTCSALLCFRCVQFVFGAQYCILCSYFLCSKYFVFWHRYTQLAKGTGHQQPFRIVPHQRRPLLMLRTWCPGTVLLLCLTNVSVAKCQCFCGWGEGHFLLSGQQRSSEQCMLIIAEFNPLETFSVILSLIQGPRNVGWNLVSYNLKLYLFWL